MVTSSATIAAAPSIAISALPNVCAERPTRTACRLSAQSRSSSPIGRFHFLDFSRG